ncbi:uncharacterized protein LOC111048544 [Nilaparvata lugens]|uniref:uncharacterized protein LOC111048544 n=1 Tax=Nilaparvata lugens TaxID=108931 RepID=UPI00193E6FD2|nr:uncharacterized protein LOC111048544 [Nilaparvata lugens]
MDSAAGWLFPEILEMIFSNLELKDLVACSGVNRTWNEAANNAKLWRKFVSKSDLSWLPTSVSCEMHSSSSSSSSFTSPSSSSTDYNQNAPLNQSPPPALPESNPYKTIIQQRNLLKHNWTHGFFTEFHLDPTEYDYGKCGPKWFHSIDDVSYPSSAPQHCLFYPLLGELESGEFVLILFRFDAQLIKVVCTLPVDFPPVMFLFVCVMRDYIVWLLKGGVVQYISLPKCDKCCESPLENCKVQTLADLNSPFKSYYYLTMDTNHILVSTLESLFVWNKKSLKLTLSCTPPISPDGRSLLEEGDPLCLDDGYLIICYSNHLEGAALIEEYNLETNNKLQTKLEMEGSIDGIECSGNFIVMKCENGMGESFTRFFQVRQKNDLEKIIFTYNCGNDGRYTTEYDLVGNSFLIYNIFEGSREYLEIEISTGIRSPVRELPTKCRSICILIDNLALISPYNNNYTEIWDWRKNLRCQVLHGLDRSASSSLCATGKWLISQYDCSARLSFKVFICK